MRHVEQRTSWRNLHPRWCRTPRCCQHLCATPGRGWLAWHSVDVELMGKEVLRFSLPDDWRWKFTVRELHARFKILQSNRDTNREANVRSEPATGFQCRIDSCLPWWTQLNRRKGWRERASWCRRKQKCCRWLLKFVQTWDLWDEEIDNQVESFCFFSRFYPLKINRSLNPTLQLMALISVKKKRKWSFYIILRYYVGFNGGSFLTHGVATTIG